MKNAYRVYPIVLGSRTFTAVAFGDEHCVLPMKQWPYCLDLVEGYSTDESPLYDASTFEVARRIYDGLVFRKVADLEVHSSNDNYIISFTTDDAADK